MKERTQPPDKVSRRETGFTLVETLIAIVVLAIGVMSLAMLIPFATENDYRARVDTTATFVAMRQLEGMLAQPYTVTNYTAAADGADNTAANLTLTCNANPVNPPASNCEGGAQLVGGLINFSQAYADVSTGYKRTYIVQASASSDTPKVNQGTYEIRWNISETTNGVRTIVIAARLRGNHPGAIAVPANLRAVRMR